MKRLLFVSLFYFLCHHILLAQGMTVTGTVVDSKDVPMPGVLVEIVGRSETATTDIDGRFRIDLPVDAKKIRISYPGYKVMEFKIKPDMLIKYGSGWGSRSSGYRGFFDIQGGFGFGGKTNVSAGNLLINNINTMLTFGYSTTHGYQINSHLFVGLGFGIYSDMIHSDTFERYDDYGNKYAENEFYAARIPVFADVRWDFGLAKKTAPYVALKAGYQFSLDVDDGDTYLANAYTWNNGYQYLYLYGHSTQGLFFQPSIGMRASIGGRRAMNIGLAYSIIIPRKLSAVYEYESYDPHNSYIRVEERKDLGVARGGAFLLNIGFDF